MATVKASKARADRKWYLKNRERRIAYQSEYRRGIRTKALEAYGGRCVCCGETEPKFLSFDHKNGHGHQDRKSLRTGNGWYQKLLRDHPEDIQILCHNCNLSKGFYGACPHDFTLGFDFSAEVGHRFSL